MTGQGRITGISGPTVSVRAEGLKLYDLVYVGEAMLTGEVVRLARDRAVVQVYENTRGLAVGEPVRSTGAPLSVRLGPGLLGGLFDGLQRPLKRMEEEIGPFITGALELHGIDYTKPWTFEPEKKRGDEISPGEALGHVMEGAIRHPILPAKGLGGRLAEVARGQVSLDEPFGVLEDGREIFGCHEWPARTPRPVGRKLEPTGPLVTGQRSIDFMLPLARGGTAVMPGGFGTGKTVLEQAIAKFTDVDVVVYVGCGERGNEMAEIIEELAAVEDPRSGLPLMQRTVLVANTSNMPVAAREASIYSAVTMAEYLRDLGLHVLLLADSLSRWAEALREISTTLEELPGEEGYPTYLASRLAEFFERAGAVETPEGKTGSLSMILSVSPPGGDFTEPVTQACLRASGAFLMLDTSLANKRVFPALNWSQSYSLYERELASKFGEAMPGGWEEARRRTKELLKAEESLTEITEVVGTEGLQDADRLTMETAERIRSEFLCQNAFTDDAYSPPERTFGIIERILARHDRLAERLKAGKTFEEAIGEEGQEGKKGEAEEKR
ncbi:MAG: V-type ATP synthase subunit A [Nitrospirota bacterium]